MCIRDRWMPAYGPETRGGFANCTVVVSDEEIGSPVISHPRSIIVLNLPSLDRFEDFVKPNGVLVINTSLVNREARRTDIKIIKVPATEIATEVGDQRAANMVALGAFLEIKPIVSKESVIETFKKLFKSKPHLVPINVTALERGALAAREQMTAV